MSSLFGGNKGSQDAGGGFNIVGGGTGAPWSWGVSDFDQSMIDAATGSNEQAITNRYNQLGLGGSSMETGDLAEAGLQGQALTGQEQTANVGQPALNPALQPQLNSLIGTRSTGTGSSIGTGLGQLAGLGGSLSGLASQAAGGAGAGGGTSGLVDAAFTSFL